MEIGRRDVWSSSVIAWAIRCECRCCGWLSRKHKSISSLSFCRQYLSSDSTTVEGNSSGRRTPFVRSHLQHRVCDASVDVAVGYLGNKKRYGISSPWVLPSQSCVDEFRYTTASYGEIAREALGYFMILRAFTERLGEREYGATQVPFHSKCVRPHGHQQVVLGHDFLCRTRTNRT